MHTPWRLCPGNQGKTRAPRRPPTKRRRAAQAGYAIGASRAALLIQARAGQQQALRHGQNPLRLHRAGGGQVLIAVCQAAQPRGQRMQRLYGGARDVGARAALAQQRLGFGILAAAQGGAQQGHGAQRCVVGGGGVGARPRVAQRAHRARQRKRVGQPPALSRHRGQHKGQCLLRRRGPGGPAHPHHQLAQQQVDGLGAPVRRRHRQGRAAVCICQLQLVGRCSQQGGQHGFIACCRRGVNAAGALSVAHPQERQQLVQRQRGEEAASGGRGEGASGWEAVGSLGQHAARNRCRTSPPHRNLLLVFAGPLQQLLQALVRHGACWLLDGGGGAGAEHRRCRWVAAGWLPSC